MTRNASPEIDAALRAYEARATTFVVGLPPADALRLDSGEVLRILRARLGDVVDTALAVAAEPGPVPPNELPAALRSPEADASDGGWLKRANVVGINVRTVGDIGGVLAYALTLPAVHGSIHLLPILEPGVVASLYAPVSWEVDPAIRSIGMSRVAPALSRAENQVRAVVHLLHAMGRTVGMDVVPHVDRFSEMALAGPDLFEWLERRDDQIARFGARVVPDVERAIHAWVLESGAAAGPNAPTSAMEFFRDWSETDRTRALFGPAEDPDGRRERRIELIRALHPTGFETVPATMGPPYRGLEVDPSPDARIVDDLGLEWREYRMTHPRSMSRVFGPLARYAMYETVSPNDWALDHERPRLATWDYVTRHYSDLRERLGFDFMRGDMAHVQTRMDGVPATPSTPYDILGSVRDRVRDEQGIRSFAYLAETFLAPPGTMAYGDEMDHLEASGADVTLGDLQSVPVGDPVFRSLLRRYRDLLETRTVAPMVTVMTADKDDPRFDAAYATGAELRMFLALFLPDMPSYLGLGFEMRDVADGPRASETYTKHYVFHRTTGIAATRGPYRFGSNRALFDRITRIREAAEAVSPTLAIARVRWLRPPDPTDGESLLAWLLEGGRRLLAVANVDTARSIGPRWIPGSSVVEPPARWVPAFSALSSGAPASDLAWNGSAWPIGTLAPGEVRLYGEA